jgi:hypothetical protein
MFSLIEISKPVLKAVIRSKPFYFLSGVCAMEKLLSFEIHKRQTTNDKRQTQGKVKVRRRGGNDTEEGVD